MLMCTLIPPLQITSQVILHLIDLRVNSSHFPDNISGYNMKLTVEFYVHIYGILKVAHFRQKRLLFLALKMIHGILKSRRHLKSLGCYTKLTSSENEKSLITRPQWIILSLVTNSLLRRHEKKKYLVCVHLAVQF